MVVAMTGYGFHVRGYCERQAYLLKSSILFEHSTVPTTKTLTIFGVLQTLNLNNQSDVSLIAESILAKSQECSAVGGKWQVLPLTSVASSFLVYRTSRIGYKVSTQKGFQGALPTTLPKSRHVWKLWLEFESHLASKHRTRQRTCKRQIEQLVGRWI